jgi:CRP-like cAMP-binding protein
VAAEDGHQTVVAQLRKGSFFGELAVVYDIRRAATVRAVTDVVALKLSRKDVTGTVTPAQLPKLRFAARLQVFSTVPLLDNLPEDTKFKVAERMRSDTFSKGVVIAEAGRPQSRLYIIEDGMVKLSRPADIPAKTLQAGQAFGVIGLLSGGPHPLSVVAASDEVRTFSISYQEILACAEIVDSPNTLIDERPRLERCMHESLCMHLLRQVRQFAYKPDEHLRTLMRYIETVTFRAGDTVFTKGTSLSAVYILKQGRLIVDPSAGDSDGGDDHAEYYKKCEDESLVIGADLIAPERLRAAEDNLASRPDSCRSSSRNLIPTPRSQATIKGLVVGGLAASTAPVHAPCTFLAETEVQLLRLPPDALLATLKLARPSSACISPTNLRQSPA